MMLEFVYLNDYVHELFLSMYEIHYWVFVLELMLLHDRQVNEHHAMDNHFDLMNAMVHVVMMMHYEDANASANVNVNVVSVDHNVVYMEYVVQQEVVLLMVDDNNQLFLLIFLVLKMN